MAHIPGSSKTTLQIFLSLRNIKKYLAYAMFMHNNKVSLAGVGQIKYKILHHFKDSKKQKN